MSQIRGPLLILLGLAMLAVAVAAPSLWFAGLLVAGALLFAAVTRLGSAYPIARTLQPLVKQSVQIEIWGEPLPVAQGSTLEVHSISAFGVGLLIQLRVAGSDARTLLKVAQPKGTTPLERGLEISGARYVAWAGKRLEPAGSGRPAVRIRAAG